MCISMAFVIFYLSVHGMNNIKYIFIVTKQIAKHYTVHADHKKYFSSVSLNSQHKKNISNTNYSSEKVTIPFTTRSSW
jgi:hypothetical protein